MDGEGYGGGVLSISTMKALVRGVAWKEVAMMSVNRETLVMRFMVGMVLGWFSAGATGCPAFPAEMAAERDSSATEDSCILLAWRLSVGRRA